MKSISIISKAIDKIYNHEASSLSYEELYRNAYTLVINKHGQDLYKNLKQSIEKNILRYNDDFATLTDDEFLNKFNELWNNHQISLRMISDICMYLDRNFVEKKNLPKTYPMGMSLFKKQVFRNPSNYRRFIENVLGEINKERNGEIIDKNMIRNSL